MSIFLFTGAQSTGKTTLLKEIIKEYPEYKIVTNIARDLKTKTNLALNKQGTYESQQLIYNTLQQKLELVEENFNCIGDRSLIDVIAYTTYLYKCDRIGRSDYNKQLSDLKQWNLTHKSSCIYMYTPIEFQVLSDGVRDIDEEYREFIDKTIYELLKDSGNEYHILTGSVENRLCKIRNILNTKN